MYISSLYMFQIMDLNHFEILYSEYLYYSKLIDLIDSKSCMIVKLKTPLCILCCEMKRCLIGLVWKLSTILIILKKMRKKHVKCQHLKETY